MIFLYGYVPLKKSSVMETVERQYWIRQDLIVENLLLPLWESISADYKSKYKSNIWEQFENFLRSSAYVSNLQRFIENFKRLMPCNIRDEFVERLVRISDAGLDKLVLKEIREKTSILVLKVRAKRQEKRKGYEEKMSAKNSVEQKEEPNENLFV